jgi:phage terminase small subunit
MSSKLNARQQLFVAEYLKDLNATQAAIRAGYSEKTARQIGARLLTNVVIAEAIATKAQKKIDRIEITSDRVLNELAMMGFANMLDYISVQNGDAFVDLSQLTREQAAAIQEITVEEYSEGRGEEKRDIKRTRFKLGDKRGSLELLGKFLKLFTDKHEHKFLDLNDLSDEQLKSLAARLGCETGSFADSSSARDSEA